LIALIAKARLRSTEIRERRSEGLPSDHRLPDRRSLRLALKRPVLLQTHPGIRAVRLQTRDWLLIRRQRLKSRDDGSLPSSHPLSSVIR
jgi:hypothetical protein